MSSNIAYKKTIQLNKNKIEVKNENKLLKDIYNFTNSIHDTDIHKNNIININQYIK